MFKTTEQMKKWMEGFGKEYTNRNALTWDGMNEAHTKKFGINRIELNNLFIGELNRLIKILEIGSNIGNQLLLLQKMGFRNLYGIEINDYAIELSKSRTEDIDIIQGSAFDIPFKDECFDLVFTSDVLIHINPRDIKMAMQEIHRCAKGYIWGFEYYADKYIEVVYRGRKNLLWKTNFPELYLNLFEDLELVKKKQLKNLGSNNIDEMFFLRKVGTQ